MAKAFEVAAVMATALCISAVLSFVHGSTLEEFSVEGRVYCDTCRVAFETPLSYPLSGARVGLECHNETTNMITLSTEVVTDKNGAYKITADGDYADDLCVVSLIASSDPECSELIKGVVHDDHVALTNQNGITGVDRYANPLGFAKKKALSGCTKVLLDMGLFPPEFYIM